MLQPRSTAARPCLNGVLLILAGYLCGAAIPHSAGFMAAASKILS